MQYKTIILELIEQRPELYQRLVANRTLLSTAERFASLLKESHEAWIKRLRHGQESENQQLASQALEMALDQIGIDLPNNSDTNGSEDLPLADVIRFLRLHTPQS